MQTLTKKQKQVLDYIRSFIAENEHAPSYEEIAHGLGLSSPSTIHSHVEKLEQKGYLKKKWNANRSIDLSGPTLEAHSAVELPLAGRIAAGLPLEAIQDYETIAVPSDMIGKHDTYVLMVKGDSMQGDHVLDGDYVIVERRPSARDGDMVVALVRNSEATLKRYRRDRDKIRLEPANPAYPVMVYDEEDVAIQGIVVGILRKYGR
ncbi:MAG: transcriptional repressor LexA [Desulfomonile tiedjei]|uniref:LexA repressor n=1 Tax=Desulfomonile tiedjei TaxID=2358 RepID=A0A9D6V3J2_9BACT|nr:transcriptional repressor LexA [Desulfomonile tiedjei]